MSEVIGQYALHQRVLCVAVATVINDNIFDWAAYCCDVPGICHKDEVFDVASYGDKISPKLATILFPDFDITKYRG